MTTAPERARWRHAHDIFHAAADLPATEQRAYLQRACAGDAAVLAHVLAMLSGDARSSPLDRDLDEIASQVLAPRRVPAQIGGYRILRWLGEGGMGAVYLAEHPELGRQVAIKLLSDPGGAASRERFEREQRVLARLEHPAIARLYEAGVDDDTPYFVMEYVDGAPITAHCRARGASLLERLGLFRALCEAVRFAHQHAIIHRDLKPTNVLVTRDGSVRLLDFGIAKELDLERSSRTDAQPMTRAYAAPEQLRGEPVGSYTDVYALGLLLYELLVGRLPGAPRPSAAPGVTARKAAWADLDVLVLAAMHPEPQRRYPSVEALIRDVDHYLRGEPLEQRADGLGYRLGKLVRRHRRAVGAAALAIGLAVAGTGWFLARLAAERERTDHQAAIATAVNRFLGEDFLGRSSPYESGASAESLIHAIHAAIPDVDRRFAAEPRVAAKLHDLIAASLDARADRAGARAEYDRAATLYTTTDGALSEDAIIARLRRAGLEARANEPGSLERARTILAEQAPLVARLSAPRPDVAMWLGTTRGLVAIMSGDAGAAVRHFEAALAECPPGSEAQRALQQRLISAYTRLGDGPTAERLARALLAELTRIGGPDSPRVYLVRQALVHALFVQQKLADVLAETRSLVPAFVTMLGERHIQTLQLLSIRAAAETYLGRFADAARDDLELQRRASLDDPMSLWAVVGSSDAGEALCRDGQLADGMRHARDGHARVQQAFRANPIVTSGAAYSLATCLIATGALNEAEAALNEINLAAVQQGGDAMDYPAAVALARAEIALGRGDLVAAKTLLRSAAVFAQPGAIVYQQHKLADLTARVVEQEPRK